MKKYELTLVSEVSKSFFSNLAAQSLDINVEEKSKHEFSIEADLDSPFNVGVIVGASGSGKTTFAKHVYGDDCFKTYLKKEVAVIDQFPEEMTYDDRAAMLNGVGLSSVPCWIKPAAALSNGQQARAEAALAMAHSTDSFVIDEWTSVVDRTVAKAMSFCLAKHARRTGKKIVLLSCHYDVIEWLAPDWIVDCNSQRFEDRRLLRPDRQERLKFEIREVSSRSWPMFSKYHYLTKNLPGGKNYFFGLFHNGEQIGFQCFSNYVPQTKKGDSRMIMHFNRIVIHPDYCGLGLGLQLINETSEIMLARGYRIMGKFSSTPVYKALSKSPLWRLRDISRPQGTSIQQGTLGRSESARTNLKIYSFEFLGKAHVNAQDTKTS